MGNTIGQPLSTIQSIFNGLPEEKMEAIVRSGILPVIRDGNYDDFDTVKLNVIRKALCLKQPRRWREKDGVIYFSVTSDGTTGRAWIKRLEKKGSRTDYQADCELCSAHFKPMTGVTTEIAVLKGMLFSDENRTTRSIYAWADRRKLEKLNAEAACLIRELFTDEEIEEMGLRSIIAMSGDSNLLCVSRGARGDWLGAFHDVPDYEWERDRGFAFAVPDQRSK